jgi:hypothetical protein
MYEEYFHKKNEKRKWWKCVEQRNLDIKLI